MSHTFRTAIAAMTLSGLAGGAFAQTQQTPQAPAQGTQVQADVSDADLRQFAGIQADIQTIRENFQADQKATSDEAELTALQNDAQAELDAVIAESPLSLEELDQIATLIQSDQGVQERYIDIAQQ